ncbi:hypothetical protein AB4393_25000 [Vibrio splendidus]|uniref:hypothetical protein n=1 Tax=Vibrio TaxID=662 RepID=UPI0003138C97|nr:MULTISPECIES: hypothetical protein [Vibrio]CAK1760119.1 hypothetical protein VCRA2113O322_140035 [Vibrio crassostreae]CAK2579497.1 hypothetical protein VCRA2113O323_150098 [Vibrio crassostreae]CAK2983173.1 hypothetical protein VCRA2113O325_40409 [Vibrio crassostreae]
MYYICNTLLLSTPKVIPPLPIDDIETVKILKKVTPAAKALSAEFKLLGSSATKTSWLS